tara:strand:- start:1952 stop:2107 length:156 start_codon:yes stop_codon:yes gene_type:complete
MKSLLSGWLSPRIDGDIEILTKTKINKRRKLKTNLIFGFVFVKMGFFINQG